QCKTFGNQRLPEGWLIVAAGNPPEYNKSVRDFDVVTLDRVKRIDVSEDFAVWKEYARRRGLHGAVISYLDIRKEDFYRIETTADGLHFATARGWEDLSELILAYEKLGLRVERNVVEQYIQLPRIAKDFANYLELYYKYQKTYHVEDILQGTWPAVTVSQLRAAPFDEKISVMGLILSRLGEESRRVRTQDALTEALHGALLDFRARVEREDPAAVLEDLARRCTAQIHREKEAGRLDREQRDLTLRTAAALEDYRARLIKEEIPAAAAMDAVREWFAQEVARREQAAEDTSRCFDNAFRFLEAALDRSQELVLFVTEITAGYDTSWFVENFGCDAYFRHNRELLFDSTRQRLRRELLQLRQEGQGEPKE
ncbi:MAG: ATPase, partial [Oscillospiraceae bacterium]|nr:ATPase [Oscillospiraceae bacterium]